MSDTCKQASEAPAVNLNPIATVVSYATHRNESGRLVIACKIEAVRPEELAFGTSLFTHAQANEMTRIAVRSALETEAEHYAGEFAALRDKLNEIYFERNQLAIALGRMAILHQQKGAIHVGDIPAPAAGYGFDPASGRAVVYVALPMGHQVSWHMDDKTTEYLKRLGPKPLPLFEGSWDGTFLGREIGWPVKYVRVQKSLCEQAMDFGKSPFADMPEGATHYRVCTGGKNRYYKQLLGEWQYFHAHGQMWHPTDLSDDYLEEHIHRIAGDTEEQSATITAQGNTITSLNALSNRVAALEAGVNMQIQINATQPGVTLDYLAKLIAEYPLRKKEDQE